MRHNSQWFLRLCPCWAIDKYWACNTNQWNCPLCSKSFARMTARVYDSVPSQIPNANSQKTMKFIDSCMHGIRNLHEKNHPKNQSGSESEKTSVFSGWYYQLSPFPGQLKKHPNCPAPLQQRCSNRSIRVLEGRNLSKPQAVVLRVHDWWFNSWGYVWHWKKTITFEEIK